MQINAISTSITIPVAKNNAPQNSQPAPDQAVLHDTAGFFTSLVQEAGKMPEVRGELVDAFKARIHSGNYPPPDIIDGLTRLIGGGLVQQAKSGS